MRAAVYHGRGDVRVEDVPIPVPREDELLLRVSAVGICGTDAHEYSTGPHMFPIAASHPVSGHVGPMIPGHEIAGVVVATGSAVTSFTEGMLVVSGAGISCGECHWCKRGRTNLCRSYSTLGLHQHGGLAEFVAVPADTCVDAGPFGVTPDTAALAQPMSIAVHAMRRGRLDSDDTAVIIGAGGIGAFLTYAAAQVGATVLVSDMDQSRLDIAGALGAKYLVRPHGEESIKAKLAREDLIPTVIFEVSGSLAGLSESLAIAPRGCRIVLVGLQSKPVDIEIRTVSLTELELIGTNAHVKSTDLTEALRLLASRADGWEDIAPEAISLDDLVSDGLVPLAEHRSTRIKTLIDPWIAATRKTRMS